MTTDIQKRIIYQAPTMICGACGSLMTTSTFKKDGAPTNVLMTMCMEVSCGERGSAYFVPMPTVALCSPEAI